MTDDTDELERLRSKNVELLAELKAAKAEVATLTARVTEQDARLNRLEVQAPTERLIGEVAMPGSEALWELAFRQHFQIERSGDGLAIRTLDGKPVALPPLSNTPGREVEREARFTAEDLRALVDTAELRGTFAPITVASRASGGGAGGTRPGGGASSPKQPDAVRAEPKPPPLGLR